jgi:hypothetical protein
VCYDDLYIHSELYYYNSTESDVATSRYQDVLSISDPETFECNSDIFGGQVFNMHARHMTSASQLASCKRRLN